MQSFVAIDSATTLAASLAQILNNDKTIMSCSSGTAFPTTNLQVGMLCLRTDQNKLYQLQDTTPTWVLLADLAYSATLAGITGLGGTPAAAGTASAGTSTAVARADHVHPAQTSISGNAGTATKWATARTLTFNGGATGSVSLDGSADVSVTLTLAGNAPTATNATTAAMANALNTANNYQVNSVGVGTAASGTAGEIRATGNITAYYSSDARLKENVKVIENAIEKLKQIDGVSFDWTDEFIEKSGGEDGYFTRKADVGVIAQDLQKVLPEVVAKREDGYLAVRYDRIVALLIAAMKEQQARIEALEAK